VVVVVVLDVVVDEVVVDVGTGVDVLLDVTGASPLVVAVTVDVVVPAPPRESNNLATPQATATITAATISQRTREPESSR